MAPAGRELGSGNLSVLSGSNEVRVWREEGSLNVEGGGEAARASTCAKGGRAGGGRGLSQTFRLPAANV